MKRPIPFGKYYLLERINVGGMAEVFRAKAYGVEGFERLLAVKRILPNIAEDEEFIEMFIDEAKIAVQLNHANIAQIFDLGKVDDSYFIALEYIHGKDLRAIFDRCGSHSEPMPVPQACFIIMKVCEGLDYAHNKRDGGGDEMHLVHRDVSPQNVLISYEGEVKLVDFGIAKAAGKASKTQAGILKGKFGYMSPEQVRGLPLDRRSDIFSVGICLYELLTGERLFLGESDFSTLEKVRNVEILPPSTYNRKVGEELEQIVLKALAKDVEDRYQNAIDLHDDLQAYMYTSGEFYSRKDLAFWMKQSWTDEIREEAKKLEEYREMPVPEPGDAQRSVPSSPTESHPVSSPPPPPVPGGNGHSGAMSMPQLAPRVEFPTKQPSISQPGSGADPAHAATALNWDDEEVETQIYDKPAAGEELSVPDGPIDTHPPMINPTEAMPPPQVSIPIALSMSDAGAAVQQGPVGPSRPGTAEMTRAPLPTEAVPRASRGGGRARGRRPMTMVAIITLVAAVCGGALYYFLAQSGPGTLSLVAIPSDVEVYIGGQRQAGAGTPLTRELEPGFHQISVRKKGYEAWNKRVKIESNAKLHVAARLEVLATASIELRTRPSGGVVFLDGRRLNTLTPMKITQITPGRHRLEVKKSAGYNTWVHEFDIEADQKLRLFQKLLPLQLNVRIMSVPSGAAFVVRDGQRERLGRTPINIKLNPKYSYVVVVERDGFKPWSKPLRFDGDAPISVMAKLEKEGGAEEPPEVRKPKPVRPPKPRVSSGRHPKPRTKVAKPPKPVVPKPLKMGILQIGSYPSTRITIDRKAVGNTPMMNIPLPVGRHRVTLSNPKFNISETFTVMIQDGRPTRVVKKFK